MRGQSVSAAVPARAWQAASSACRTYGPGRRADAVAVSMADGPAAALVIVDALADDPALRGYHLLPAVRADLLARLGRADQAREEFERAAALTANDSERAHLLRRAAAAAAG